MRAYQLSLVHDQQVSWSRFNQRVCALRFLYRVTLGKDGAITHLKYHTALSTAYAAGLRVAEVLH